MCTLNRIFHLIILDFMLVIRNYSIMCVKTMVTTMIFESFSREILDMTN
jgi:hypothetical protein